MSITLLSILDTEWPALLAAAVFGLLFIFIRAYLHNRRED